MPPYFCMGKMLKNCFLKMYLRLIAETYNIWLKKYNCLATVKSLGVICPCPRAMYRYKNMKSFNVFFENEQFSPDLTLGLLSKGWGWKGVAKVSCNLRHWGRYG